VEVGDEIEQGVGGDLAGPSGLRDGLDGLVDRDPPGVQQVVHADALAGSQLAVLEDRSEVSLCGRAAVPDSDKDELDVGEDAGQ
jgi:hypothetical protein